MKHPEVTTHVVQKNSKRQKHANSQEKNHSSTNVKSGASGIGRDELIRLTAYTLYEARSCVAGYELDDWLQAEAQVEEMLAQNQSPQNAAQAA